MSRAAPRRVLRLAIAGWGLGHLALGHSRSGIAWLVAELVALAATAALTVLLAETTWYLVPFAAGAAFMSLWALQAVFAYRLALGDDVAEAPTPRRSPAAAIVWLTIPLLLWGTGFWLVAGGVGSPEAVLDRFESAWPRVAANGADRLAALTDDPVALAGASSQALEQLAALCAADQLTADCSSSPEALLRDVRMRITQEGSRSVTAVAEVVHYERRPTRFLGIFAASELMPVPYRSLLQLQLEARPGPLGSRRWTIVGASAS